MAERGRDVTVTVSAAGATAVAPTPVTETTTRAGGVETTIRRFPGWAKGRRGRPPGTHQPRWAQKFCEFKTQLNEDGYESPVEGENARLSDFELRILVAIWDYETAHLVLWSYDPKAERRAAADRVLKAIKPLI
jgi:hypothetical protein